MSDLQRREHTEQLSQPEDLALSDHLLEQQGQLDGVADTRPATQSAAGPYDWLGGGGSPPPEEEQPPSATPEPQGEVHERQDGDPASSPSGGGGSDQGASPDGASPDGGAPDGTVPVQGASPDPSASPDPEAVPDKAGRQARDSPAVKLDASSPGGLLSSLSSQAPSGLLSAYGKAQAKVPALLSAQRDSLAATLPERATPTGLPPTTGELDGRERPQESAPKAALPAGEGPDVQASVRAPATAPAAKQPPTSVQEGADGQVASSAAKALRGVGFSTATVPARFGDRPALQSTGQADPSRMSQAQAQGQREVGSAGAEAARLSLQDLGSTPSPQRRTPSSSRPLCRSLSRWRWRHRLWTPSRCLRSYGPRWTAPQGRVCKSASPSP